MILHVFGVQGGEVQLLHEADQLGAREVAKRVAGEAEAERRKLARSWNRLRAGQAQRSSRREQPLPRQSQPQPHPTAQIDDGKSYFSWFQLTIHVIAANYEWAYSRVLRPEIRH